MRFLTQFSLVALLGVAMLTAQAQDEQKSRRPGGRFGGGFGGGQLGLLTQKSVQEELKLTEDQVKKATELQQKQREGFQGFQNLTREERRQKMQEQGKATQAALAEILKPEQVKRLKQINLQQQGVMAIGNPEVAEALNFTAEQKEKLKGIAEENRKAMGELFQGGGFNEETRKKVQDLRKGVEEKVQGVMTAEQKTKWKELTGEPFKGEIRRPEFRRPGGRRNKTNSNS